LDVLSPVLLRQLFDKYVKDRGEAPSPDVEPTPEQLSAVSHLLRAGVLPYADFSLFGPFGKRLLKKLTFTQHVYLPESGCFQRQELPGPADYTAWLRSWRVYECALLLLEAVRAERLRAYEDRIYQLHLTFGQGCWHIIYLADVRMRSEAMERIRRDLESAAYNNAPSVHVGFRLDPSQPWDAVFGAAARDDRFWAAEVREKCILQLARVGNAPAALSDGTVGTPILPLGGGRSVQPSTLPPGAGKGRNNRKKKPQNPSGGSHTPKGKGKSHGNSHGGSGRGPSGGKGKPQGKPVRDPAVLATEICRLYNDGKCPRTPCPNGRRHICLKCSASHPQTLCRA
jgi:hypothetical protein